MNQDVNPEMIRTARLSRDKSGTQVGKALGIGQSAYSKIENGDRGITTEQLEALSKELRYPPAFFKQNDRIWGTASPHHRKRRSLSPHQLLVLEAWLNVLRLNLRRLSTNIEVDAPFEFPIIDLDEVGTPAEAAQHVRRLLRVPSGPIVSLVRLLEDAGVLIIEQPYSHDRFDAISIWGPGERPVILLNASFPADRKRHTLAHEAAHLVLHCHEVTDDPEAEAEEFARELLMPAREIRPELKDLRLDKLPDIKRRWRVSMRSVIYHARSLGILNPNQARYMFMRMNQMYGAKREPIALPAETPTLVAELLQRHKDDLGYSVNDIAAIVRMDVDDFERAYGLARRHLRSV